MSTATTTTVATESLRAFVERTVAGFPPLNESQVHAVAAALKGGAN
ncbi:hypothetical protein RF638_04345 [Kocuria sp. CPCC 205235]